MVQRLKIFATTPPLPSYEILQIFWLWLSCICFVTFCPIHFPCLKCHLYVCDYQTTIFNSDVSPGSRLAQLNFTQHFHLCFKLYLVLHDTNLIINYCLWQSHFFPLTFPSFRKLHFPFPLAIAREFLVMWVENPCKRLSQ